jgi:hypothetical protein
MSTDTYSIRIILMGVPMIVGGFLVAAIILGMDIPFAPYLLIALVMLIVIGAVLSITSLQENKGTPPGP